MEVQGSSQLHQQAVRAAARRWHSAGIADLTQPVGLPDACVGCSKVQVHDAHH